MGKRSFSVRELEYYIYLAFEIVIQDDYYGSMNVFIINSHHRYLLYLTTIYTISPFIYTFNYIYMKTEYIIA